MAVTVPLLPDQHISGFDDHGDAVAGLDLGAHGQVAVDAPATPTAHELDGAYAPRQNMSRAHARTTLMKRNGARLDDGEDTPRLRGGSRHDRSALHLHRTMVGLPP